MKVKDFIPSGDDALKAFVTPFSAKITATPTAYGVTAANATTLATLVSAFTTALATAKDPATRGPAAVLAKDEARTALVANVRSVAKQIQGTMTVTNAQRQALGLTIKAQPTPIPAPAAAPAMEIVSVSGVTVKIRLSDADGSSKRRKPLGVQGATIVTYIGATPPSSADGWMLQGSTTKSVIDIQFPASSVAGTKVWIAAYWYSAKALSGPACNPITTNLQGGSLILSGGEMKIAA